MVILGIGFFGGMEYKAYQIRSAIAGIFDPSSLLTNVDNLVKSDTKVASKPANDLSGKVGFEVTKKSFTAANYQDQNNFTFKFTNNSAKDIEGVEGIVTFKDLFGNVIKQVHITYDEGLKITESKLYSVSVYYNQFSEEDIKLRQTDLSKLKYDWETSMIIYTDGSKESI